MTKLNHEFFTEAEFKTNKPVGPRGFCCPDGTEVWFYYANNLGRGTNNVTAIHVTQGNDRYDFAYVRKAENAGIVIKKTRFSAWAGKLSRYITIFK